MGYLIFVPVICPPPPPQTHTHTHTTTSRMGRGRGGQRISKWLNTDDIQRYTNCRTFRRRNGRCKHSYWLDITVWCMPLFPTLTNKPRIMSLNWVSSRSLSNFKSFFPSMFSSASFDVTILTLIFPTRKKKTSRLRFWRMSFGVTNSNCVICIIADVQMCKC